MPVVLRLRPDRLTAMAASGHHGILLQGDFVQAPLLGRIEIFRNYLLREILIFLYEHLFIIELHRH